MNSPDRPSTPRPAWCPECGADYAGDSSACPACGYDAGGELVLFGALADPAVRRRKRLLWTGAMLATLAAAGVGLAAILQKNAAWKNRPPQSPGDAVLAMWLPLTLVAVLSLLKPLATWWLSTPTTRRCSGQVRFGPRGWGTCWRPGPIRWREWWASRQIALPRGRDGTLRLMTFSRSGQRTNWPSTPSRLVPPPGSSLNAVVRFARDVQAASTDTALAADVAEITHCPECGYVLGVPARLARPGHCPECGWAFGEQTIVLYGHGGPTYNARRARGLGWRWIVRDKLLLLTVVAGAVAALVLLPLGLKPLLSRMSPTAFALLGGGFLVGLAVLTTVSLGRLIQTKTDVAVRRKLLAEGQLRPLGPHQLRLTPEGCAQRGGLNARPAPFIGPATLCDWSGVAWRVTRGRGTVRVMIARPPRTPLARWRRRTADRLGEFGRLLAFRPVDFTCPADRRAARALRRLLRAWPATREHRRRPRP